MDRIPKLEETASVMQLIDIKSVPINQQLFVISQEIRQAKIQINLIQFNLARISQLVY